MAYPQPLAGPRKEGEQVKYQITQTAFINSEVGTLNTYHVVEADTVDIRQEEHQTLVMLHRDNQLVAAFEGFVSIVEYKEEGDAGSN